jgi:hypothetical protein
MPIAVEVARVHGAKRCGRWQNPPPANPFDIPETQKEPKTPTEDSWTLWDLLDETGKSIINTRREVAELLVESAYRRLEEVDPGHELLKYVAMKIGSIKVVDGFSDEFYKRFPMTDPDDPGDPLEEAFALLRYSDALSYAHEMFLLSGYGI